MSSCNPTEIVHNKWLQSLGNRGNDLYIATIDDYIRAFMQVVVYYQFLKGDIGCISPSKEELKLRNAQRRARATGNPRVLKDAMLDILGADYFYIRDPLFKREEVFDSLKRKPDVPLRVDREAHMPDIVYYSHPRGLKKTALAQVVSLLVITEEEEEELKKDAATPGVASVSPAQKGGIHLVTSVQETKVDERTWHIVRLPKESSKAY